VENGERKMETIAERVKRVVKYLSRPLTSATLFYALYILGEIHRSPSFAHKLEKYCGDLAHALYDHGICMVVKEVNLHAFEGFYPLPASPDEYIDFMEVRAFWEEIYGEEGQKGIRERITKCINKVYPYYFSEKSEVVRILTTCIIDRLNKYPRIMHEPHYVSENARWVRTWLEYYHQKLRSPYFWTAMERIFAITNKAVKGWIAGYGERRYAQIARVMQEYGKLEFATFVDLCFSLKHHTSTFIHKLATHIEEENLVKRFFTEEGLGGISGALQRLFDAARRGSEDDVRLILRCATSAKQDWIMFGEVDVDRMSNPPAGMKLRELRMRSEALLGRILRSL